MTLDEELVKEPFVLIHLRFNVDFDKADKIISTFKDKTNMNIIIFSMSDSPQLNEKYNMIKNLQTYASMLNHNNCKIFISEWSGGGQLSQYCSNNKVIYYFDGYNELGYVLNHENLQSVSNISFNIGGAWDFKCTTDCKRSYYRTLDEMLDDSEKILNLENNISK